MRRHVFHPLMAGLLAMDNYPGTLVSARRQRPVQTPEQRESALGMAQTRREIRNAKRLRNHLLSREHQSPWIRTPHWQL